MLLKTYDEIYDGLVQVLARDSPKRPYCKNVLNIHLYEYPLFPHKHIL